MGPVKIKVKVGHVKVVVEGVRETSNLSAGIKEVIEKVLEAYEKSTKPNGRNTQNQSQMDS